MSSHIGLAPPHIKVLLRRICIKIRISKCTLTFAFTDEKEKYCLRENSELKLNFVKQNNSPKTGCNPLKYVDIESQKRLF